MADRLILAVNPGGTSTKLGVYRETESVFEESVRHLPEELEKYSTTLSQIPMRTAVVMEELQRQLSNAEPHALRRALEALKKKNAEGG